MSESSNESPARPSTLVSLVLRRVARVKNLVVATAIGHDEAHVSRILSGERGIKLSELEDFLSSIGLRVIECEGLVVSVPADELAAIRLLARKGLQ